MDSALFIEFFNTYFVDFCNASNLSREMIQTIGLFVFGSTYRLANIIMCVSEVVHAFVEMPIFRNLHHHLQSCTNHI